MFHENYVPGMSRFTPSPPEYDAVMHVGISPALRRGPLSFSHGMPPPNDGVMHDMITSGSMAAASRLGFFTQEEARATEKRNTDLAFLIGGNDAAMDEEMRAWYDAHRQDILRPPSTASSFPSTMCTPSTTSTPAADAASPPEAQKGTTEEPVVV
jgi:hypothetical protein